MHVDSTPSMGSTFSFALPRFSLRELARALRWMVQGVMVPNHDLMLPPMGELTDRERIAVVAPAGEGGGDFLSSRLLQLLSSDARLSAVNVSWAVRSTHLCATHRPEEGGDPDGGDDEIALLSEMIETILVERRTSP